METMTVNMQIRKAKRRDFVENRTLALRKNVIFYVESIITPGTFCGPITTGDHTDTAELKHWFSKGRLWIALSPLSNLVEKLEIRPAQHEMKLTSA